MGQEVGTYLPRGCRGHLRLWQRDSRRLMLMTTVHMNNKGLTTSATRLSQRHWIIWHHLGCIGVHMHGSGLYPHSVPADHHMAKRRSGTCKRERETRDEESTSSCLRAIVRRQKLHSTRRYCVVDYTFTHDPRKDQIATSPSPFYLLLYLYYQQNHGSACKSACVAGAMGTKSMSPTWPFAGGAR